VELSIDHELYCDKSLIDLEKLEREDSLLRCRYAEACRQRDLLGRNSGWRTHLATTTAYSFRQLLRVTGWVKDSLTNEVRTIRKLPDFASFCADADVISFDVFDTLLYRTVEPPAYIKRLAAKYAAELYSRRGYPLTADLFLYLRDESENRQRRVAENRGWDPESKLSAIIYEVLYRLFGSEIAERDVALLVEHELKMEIEHLRVADGVNDLLQSLKSMGKRVVAVSDTYLERDHLRDIFACLGIDRWIDAIYVSSEHLLGKYSGRLFQTILRAEAIVGTSLIHVGDTYQSDVRGAVKAGVPVAFLFDIDRLRRRRQLKRETLLSDASKVDVRRAAKKETACRGPALLTDANQPELYRVGRDIIGPAFTIFVLDVIEESYRVGAADIYYLAREGWLFRRLHETLTAQIGHLKRLPPRRHHYLYVSRLSTSLPAIHELGERELHLAFYRDRNARLADCIGAFGLRSDDYSDLGFDFSDREAATKAALFAHSEFKDRVNVRADIARANLRAYLVQENFFQSNDVKLLVDIGWNATIQANLTQAFHNDADFPLLLGYYFGRRYRHEDYLISSRSLYMPGRFFDQKRKVTIEYGIGHCLELFELAAAAPHGATLNYEEIDGGVKPVLSAGGTKLSDEQKLLQSGILDHAEAFAKSTGDNFDLSVLRTQAVIGLMQLILRPTRRQAEALRGLKHALDWGSQKTRPLIAENMGPLLVFRPSRFLGALRESYWLEGCMRVSRIPGALTGLRLVRRAIRSKEFLQRLHRISQNFFQSRVSVVSSTPIPSRGYDSAKTSDRGSDLVRI
jgi:FMN phosphatase YigB (HAD superfamily)